MNGKTVLVTGSSRGIGKAIALKFAKEGCNVIINCARSKEELMAAKKEIEDCRVQCLAFMGDLGGYEAAAELFSLVKERFGFLDLLVNNAGISYNGLFTDMTPADWDHVIKTNLTSAFNCCSLAAPGMISRKQGKIINISSVWGSAGASCEVAYSASKGGINAFTRALAKELAPSNIQVNAVACGAIDTDMNRFLSKEERNMLIEDIPANRFGTADEVADFVYRIADGNDYLNGQVIHFDGAWI